MKYHQPVLLKESVEGLNIKPEGVYVDATFGGGGHSMEILKMLKKGKLIAFDQDEDAMVNIPDDKRFIFVRQNFRFLRNFLKYYGFKSIDGLIADLGISSYHIDTPQRGFSFRFDTKLDMRMNTKADFSAQDIVNSYTNDQLTGLFRSYGELTNARHLAMKIADARNKRAITTVNELLEAIRDCLPKKNENQYLAKLFQALRIEVNKELEYLKEMLQQAAEMLKPGGRIAVISYHSLEDRVVKNFFKTGNFENKVKTDLYGNIERPLLPVNNKVIVPGEAEINENNRARSARLRIAEKIPSN
jgi:16S rRNA (cytosine1402-N4)-methyltransferase